MSEELAYSIHLGSDKNRKNKSKKIAESNQSGTTSFSNNGVQNATRLSKVNKHNLRDYDNDREMIEIIYGTDNLYKDVQNLYLQEFEQARIEYNEKQVREDRKINNYFKHISDSKLWDLACELIIELGDMEFWQDKELDYRKKMTNVYKEQVDEFIKLMPEFKIASAVIHFEEQSKSPHLHVIGVPVKENCKKGMKKQVAKSRIFTKESLTMLQNKMRVKCIESYNKTYDKNAEIKKKQKGRNRDINVKDMTDYKALKKQYEKYNKRLSTANTKTEKVDKSSKDINVILDNLKPSRINKNNRIISNEDIEIIKNYTKDVKDTTKSIKSVNDLNILIEDFEDSYNKLSKENNSLKYELELKDNKIKDLNDELSTKDKIIDKLRTEKEKLKYEVQKFKGFWRSLMKHFQEKIGFDNDKNYKYVSDDLYKNGIFDDNDNEIANNVARKVKTVDELNQYKIRKKNNDTRF